ncbi:hypothetical protein VP01_1250g9 [Puccinia sorghi]|uniref:Uncharacterized protein n=1 Tax=Puccinia sorghi TaxID=27349 RepID=A0A0L6VPE9_9BASI|nr:hypothetical protein VP01_1250g9 [Puccinia sorghi]
MLWPACFTPPTPSVLEDTGIFKKCLDEMNHNLFQPDQNSIKIVPNTLDSLGENQVSKKNVLHCKRNKPQIVVMLWKSKVEEKQSVAVLDQQMASKIIAGMYSLLYRVRSRFKSSVESAEAFLSNDIFGDFYFNPIFQICLNVIVDDEAHIFYVWGLVAKVKQKELHLMGEILMEEHSAHHIANLQTNVFFLFLKPTECTYGTKEQTPNEKLIPSLIYSSTQNHPGRKNPNSTCIHCYQSNTGDLDEAYKAFTDGSLPLISETMALGLGQKVPLEIHIIKKMGRTESESLKMWNIRFTMNERKLRHYPIYFWRFPSHWIIYTCGFKPMKLGKELIYFFKIVCFT